MRRVTHRFFVGLLSTKVLASAAVGVALPTLVWAQDDAAQDVPSKEPIKIQAKDLSQPAGQQAEAQPQTQLGQTYVEKELWGTEGMPSSQAGTTEGGAQGVTPMTTAEMEARRPMTVKNEVFALRPNAGAMVYHDTTNSTTSRAIYGLTADWNFAGAVTDNSAAFVGLSSGGLFSHLGSATSNFWGSSPSSVVNSPGANFLIIPANLKVGYNVNDNVRISARGGGNVTYRSEGVSMNVGPSTATTGTIWRIYPNVGGDLDIGLTRGLTLGFRPDYTFTPGANIFVGTVALGMSIG